MHYIKNLIPQSLKNLYHLAQAVLANIWYGFPTKKLHPHTNILLNSIIKFLHSHKIGVGVKVIGITGTDGKTTTTQMVTKILKEAGKKVAMASTINFAINGEEKVNLSHFTTLSSFAVQKFARKAVKAGCEYLVLETSSHSLDQHRIWGVEYSTALITNVTREHLDYHGTMENYRRAKKKLFEIVAKNKGTLIVNLDMERPEEYLDFDAKKMFGYTTRMDELKIENKNIQIVKAEEIQLGISSSSYKLKAISYKLNIPGLFNIENALAATCVGLSEGIDELIIKKALEKISVVPGRMELVPNDKNLNILVDFALTPVALEKLYEFIAGTKKESSKVIAVFGSCGERDRGKRPMMGEVVSRFADIIILTNDEPYRENPSQIISEIAAGIKNKKEGKDFWKIPDRREAIAKAISLAASGDVIAVTGMGAEESMIVGDKKIPWNDKAVILEELGN